VSSMSCCGESGFGGGSTEFGASSSRGGGGGRRGTEPIVRTGGRSGRSVKASDVEQLEQKLVLVGNVAVGKSSIVNRYTRGDYLEQYQATIGAAFVPKDVTLAPGDGSSGATEGAAGKTIKLQIWDTAGEEKYRAMTQFYYRKAAAGLVVFGLDDAKSFRDVETWIADLRDVCPNILIVLVGNKSDIDYDARAVRAGDIEDLVDEFGVTYCECSAKDGDGVEELFAEAAQRIFDSPESWST
jgi:small GTP-binding protein